MSKSIKLPISNAFIIMIILIIITVFILSQSFYTVDQAEEGVVLRLGRYHRIASPGFNMKIPIFEKAYMVPVTKVFNESFGFRTTQAGVQTIYDNVGFQDESNMLTGDLNIVQVQFIVQYRITNPYDYLFKVNDTQKTLRDVSQSVMNLLMGDRSIFDSISIERENIEFQAKIMINDILKQFNIGMTIDQVKLRSILPPAGDVQQAFEEVNKATQEKNTLIQQGNEEYNKEIPRALGQKEKIISEAEGYRTQKINEATGDVARYKAIYEEYKKNPNILETRMYYETLEELFKKEENIELIDKNLTNFLPLKNL